MSTLYLRHLALSYIEMTNNTTPHYYPKYGIYVINGGNDDNLREQEALDLLHGCKAPKAGEEDHGSGGDEDDVGGVHVEPVPQQLLQERLVVHRPDTKCQQDQATHLTQWPQ